MSEKNNNPESAQSERERMGLTEEEWEMYQQYVDANPEPEVPALRESAPEVTALDGLLEAFESAHSLAELEAITDLTFEEAENHEARQAAKQDLNGIVAALNTLKKETNIAQAKYDELLARYKRFSRAVGIINKNKVDHTR